MAVTSQWMEVPAYSWRQDFLHETSTHLSIAQSPNSTPSQQVAQLSWSFVLTIEEDLGPDPWRGDAGEGEVGVCLPVRARLRLEADSRLIGCDPEETRSRIGARRDEDARGLATGGNERLLTVKAIAVGRALGAGQRVERVARVELEPR